jgi:hypothetical protein
VRDSLVVAGCRILSWGFLSQPPREIKTVTCDVSWRARPDEPGPPSGIEELTRMKGCSGSSGWGRAVYRDTFLPRPASQQSVAYRGQLAASAAHFLPKENDLASSREAARPCHGCPLYKHATQVVFGEGSRRRFLKVGMEWTRPKRSRSSRDEGMEETRWETKNPARSPTRPG